MEEEKLMQIVEALLFMAPRPLTEERLAAIIGLERKIISEALLQLQFDYEREKKGMRIRCIAGAYQMVTALEVAPYLEKLNLVIKKVSLSAAALESLAIIAYKQPVTRSEVDQIRGVKSEKAIFNLLEKNLIKELGRKESLGKPILYGTTNFFLEHFGIQNLAQLPPLPEENNLPVKVE